MTAHDPALVETIAEAIGVADDYIWGLLTPDEQEPHFIRARAVLDAIATSPRRALVELPEPDAEADADLYDASFVVASDDEFMTGARTPRVVVDMAIPELFTVCTPSSHISPAEARSFAAALLAAAIAAESGSTTPESKERET